MACFFLERAPANQLNDIKLMKLLYIAERESLRQQTATMSGSNFASMKHGPVLSDAYRNLRPEEHHSVFADHIEYLDYKKGQAEENTLRLISPINPEDHFSKVELRILERVWEDHKNDSKWKLVELTHEFPEWDPTVVELKTSRQIKLEDIFQKAFHDSAEIAQSKVADIQYYEELSA